MKRPFIQLDSGSMKKDFRSVDAIYITVLALPDEGVDKKNGNAA